MTFEIEIGGRTRTVSVERAGTTPGRFRVAVDGATMIVDARRFGDYGLSLLFPDLEQESQTVQLAPSGTNVEWLAVLNGTPVPVTVNGRRTSRSGGDAAASADGEQKVSAPMPGRVVRVLVSPGDTVEARQPVVVVEAMKMENELRSPKAGTVKEVAVTAGTSVDAGRVLVVIE